MEREIFYETVLIGNNTDKIVTVNYSRIKINGGF